MGHLSTFLWVVLLCLSFKAGAQVTDSTHRDYTSYDTTLPKSDVIDTVHHIMLTRDDSMKAERQEMSKEALVQAENDKRWIKAQIQALSFYRMHGRGYVKGGRDSAARFVLKKFHEFKMQPVKKGGPWSQGFAFPVNVFPGRMYLAINTDSLAPGTDFLIDPASAPFHKGDMKVEKIDLAGMVDSNWKKTVASFDTEHLYYLVNVDSLCDNVLHIRKSQLAEKLPVGVYIIPEAGKLMWSVSREQMKATVFYVDKDVLRKSPKRAWVDVDAVLVRRERSDNIIACVPGEVADSYIVFTAHYDHLGMMGDTTYFPGASDNASGTAMMLFLASYFAKHPQHYTMVFIAFAGEEAALMGSEFFVNNPMIPLKNIKVLMNIDIMGDATDGVTVVNATEFPQLFDILKKINEKNHYLPDIRSRGKAANSDHYYFSEAGVPAFFMYSNGGHGYYHDVYDRAREVTLNHIDDVAKLLIDFAKAVK